MGDPIAKSLLCVQNIAKIAALPKFLGFVIKIETIPTAKNTIHFEMSIANKKIQFTVFQSKVTSDVKISDGNANVPTNVLKPLVSAFVIILSRPAIYLKIRT